MNVTNAISKVRFSSARPQRVQLFKNSHFHCELLCLEPQQELTSWGPCAYYVVAGSGEIRAGRNRSSLELGRFAECDDGESHSVVNASEQRLICLVISKRS